MMRYMLLNIVIAAVLLWSLRRQLIFNRKILLVLACMLVMTAIFDNFIIASQIVGYNFEHTVGIRLLYAPIEDFAYPLVGTFIIIALWESRHAETNT